jgi:hypothetical protein
MAPRDIVQAATEACMYYQQIAQSMAHDAMYFAEQGAKGAAVFHQQKAREYHDAAWDRLSRLIGVS